MADIKKLGFEGAVRISLDGGSAAQLLATSGALQGESSKPTFIGVDMPPPPSDGTAGDNRSKFVYSEGTLVVTGSVSFDCTEEVLPIVAALCTGRGQRFTVGIAGGEVGRRLQRCYMTTLTLSGATNGLVTASLSFVSASDLEVGAGFTPVKRDPSSSTYQEPLAYWYTGGPTASTDIKDWSLSVSQNATPVFGNVAGVSPLYIRIGVMDASLTVNTYLELQEIDEVSIATQTVTIVAGYEKSREFTLSPSDLETFTYTFESMLDPAGGSSGDIITFE